ncbi:MAG: ABC transporter ATP-binding protein [Armatimonadota bacterium]|nr:ABC transporter ATP-binding protein [Armatimonadota bacterium]
MTAIALQGVTKRFRSYDRGHKWLRRELVEMVTGRRSKGDCWTVLHDIDLRIEAGEIVAIVGRNGSGKSTLLKLMAGILQPNAGRVTHQGVICALLDIGTGFHEDLTGRENVFVNGAILGLRENRLRQLLPEVEAFAELEGFMDTPLRYYSSGMRARLGFAVAMSANPDIFLIDEVLSVGDEGFRRKCSAKLDELVARGRTIVIVSHDLEAVQRLCARGVWLHEGTIVEDGPIAGVCARYVERFNVSEEAPLETAGGTT